MRMWMANPKIMCRQHLLGEHNEIHKLVGHLNKKKSITGWIACNCLQLDAILSEHNKLVNEMLKRGYNHRSPLPDFSISYLPLKQQEYKVDKKASLRDLLERCERCRERFERDNI